MPTEIVYRVLKYEGDSQWIRNTLKQAIDGVITVPRGSITATEITGFELGRGLALVKLMDTTKVWRPVNRNLYEETEAELMLQRKIRFLEEKIEKLKLKLGMEEED